MPNFNADKAHINKIIDLFLAQYIWGQYNLMGLLTLFVIFFPRSGLTINLIFPDAWFDFLPFQIGQIFCHCYFLTFVLVNNLCIGVPVMAYLAYFTQFLTKELRVGLKSYRTVNKLRTPAHLQIVFRSLQVLHTYAFTFMGKLIILCNATMMITPVSINLVLIRYWSEMDLFTIAPLLLASGLIVGFWTVTLELGRVFFLKGGKTMGSWKRANWGNIGMREKVIMKKFTKSCKPILMQYGKQFTIKRVSVLVYFRGVVRGTMRALLTTKK